MEYPELRSEPFRSDRSQINKSAYFSNDRECRYWLYRGWDETLPKVMFIGLNPSTANENDDDPTIRRVCQIAKYNGFGGVYMCNCFPLVSTDPSVLEEVYKGWHESADIENMRVILEINRRCGDIVFAWGNFKVAIERGMSLAGYFKKAKALHINKNGSPKHPLYCRADTKLILFDPHRPGE